MGTVASVHVHDVADRTLVDGAIEAMWAELDRLEDLFSTFRDSSEISRINRGELHLLDASPEVIEVVDACTWLEHASDGAFRARRPGDTLLDPAGFVKGWAAELAAQHLDRAGLQQLVPLAWAATSRLAVRAATARRGGSPSPIPNSDDPAAIRGVRRSQR